MKEEAMATYAEDSKAIVGKVYDAGLSDGTAAGYKDGFAKGVASVPQPSEDGKYSQEEMDRYAQAKVDAAIAALPEDTTPISQEAFDALKSELDLTKEHLSKVESDDKADKAQIAYAKTRIENALKALQQQMDDAAAGSDASAPVGNDEAPGAGNAPEVPATPAPAAGSDSGVTPVEPVKPVPAGGDTSTPATGSNDVAPAGGGDSQGPGVEMPAGQDGEKGVTPGEPTLR